MKRQFKAILIDSGFWGICCKIIYLYFRRVNFEEWPAWFGKLCGIKVPMGVIPRKIAEPRGASNINILLEFLRQTRGISGDVAECGVFKGESLISIALYLRQLGSDNIIFALDSFQGFDEDVRIDIALGGDADNEKKISGFSQTSLAYVARKANIFGLKEKVRLIPGYFKETLRTLERNAFSFVHLDCDIYSSYKECLEFFYPRMSRGGIILLDEYCDPRWPGCNKAVDEFLVGRAETCIPIERDHFIKYFIQKA